MEALVITPEIEAAAQRLAERDGMTPTQAVEDALRTRLQELPQSKPRKSMEHLLATLHRVHAGPIDYSLTDDEILGYDKDGIPEQPYLGR